VRPFVVVIASPFRDHSACVRDVVEVVIVQALVPELAVKALDVRVLRRFAGCDQFQIDATSVSPAIQRTAGEFRPLIGPNRARPTPELADSLQHPRHIAA
jgi:hypothetical protein